MGSRFGAQPRKVSKRRHQGGGEWTSRTLTKGRAGGSSAARVVGGGWGLGQYQGILATLIQQDACNKQAPEARPMDRAGSNRVSEGPV